MVEGGFHYTPLPIGVTGGPNAHPSDMLESKTCQFKRYDRWTHTYIQYMDTLTYIHAISLPLSHTHSMMPFQALVKWIYYPSRQYKKVYVQTQNHASKFVHLFSFKHNCSKQIFIFLLFAFFLPFQSLFLDQVG